MKYKICCLNGPNLNTLGKRKKELYGSCTLQDICDDLTKTAKTINAQMSFFQSNHEGGLIDYIQKESHSFDGFIVNPGPLTFYGYALRDALVDTHLPFISVHLSNIHARQEQFRHTDIFADVALGGIYGFKENSYTLALRALVEFLSKK